MTIPGRRARASVMPSSVAMRAEGPFGLKDSGSLPEGAIALSGPEG
jgi:hypothetical protein